MTSQTSSLVESQAQTQSKRPICCKACGQVICQSQHSQLCEGGEHTFRNPAGYSFHVLSFSEAPGCELVGDRYTRDSWFPGYAWQIAICGKCQQHLGWGFSKESVTEFFGLIKTRLTI